MARLADIYAKSYIHKEKNKGKKRDLFHLLNTS